MSRSESPKLDLDWEEGLFRALRRLWRAVSPEPPAAPSPDAAHLADLQGRLAALASLIGGRPMRVLPARHRGGRRGDDVLVPAEMSLGSDVDSNAALYVLRVAVAAACAGDAGGDAGAPSSAAAPPVEGEVEPEPPTVAAAVARLRDELAAFGPAWDAARALEAARGVTESPLWGPLLAVALLPTAPPLQDEDAVSDSDEPGTEIEAPPIEEITVHALSEAPMELPTHAFEKVETVEAFTGTMRQPDASDDLGEHLDALSEVDLGDLLRGGPQAGSTMKADLALGAEVPDIGHVDADEPFVAYPEWDRKRGGYRADWCRVYPTAMPRRSDRWAQEALGRHRKVVDRLHGQLRRHRDRLRPQPRSLDGEEVDIDAVGQAWAALRAGRTPDPRLYVRQARPQRDAATTVLLDISLSTDSWIAGRRVLDVAREAVLVLGEVADRLGDRVQILAFASHTRHRIRCWRVRDWTDDWATARGRLGALQPQGYTRIGPALRHATAELERVAARHRTLLLVSDGKPTDYDRYEGRHGLADVRKALSEARQRGGQVQALAIDSVARSWLPSMLGAGSWAVLPKPELLPEALTKTWGHRS